MKQLPDELRPQKQAGLSSYRVFLLVGLLVGFVSLSGLVVAATPVSEPPVWLMMLGGFGMLGMIMRLRRRHVG
jgi:hypothetical protein